MELPSEIIFDVLKFLPVNNLVYTIQVNKTWASASARILYESLPPDRDKELSPSQWTCLKSTLESKNSLIDYSCLVDKLDLSTVKTEKMHESDIRTADFITQLMYSFEPVQEFVVPSEEVVQLKQMLLELLKCCSKLTRLALLDIYGFFDWGATSLLDSVPETVKELTICIEPPISINWPTTPSPALSEPIADQSLLNFAKKAVNLQKFTIRMDSTRAQISSYGIYSFLSMTSIKSLELDLSGDWLAYLIHGANTNVLCAIGTVLPSLKILKLCNLSKKTNTSDLFDLLEPLNLQEISISSTRNYSGVDNEGIPFIRCISALLKDTVSIKNFEWNIYIPKESFGILENFLKNSPELVKLVIGNPNSQAETKSASIMELVSQFCLNLNHFEINAEIEELINDEGLINFLTSCKQIRNLRFNARGCTISSISKLKFISDLTLTVDSAQIVKALNLECVAPVVHLRLSCRFHSVDWQGLFEQDMSTFNTIFIEFIGAGVKIHYDEFSQSILELMNRFKSNLPYSDCPLTVNYYQKIQFQRNGSDFIYYFQ